MLVKMDIDRGRRGMDYVVKCSSYDGEGEGIFAVDYVSRAEDNLVALEMNFAPKRKAEVDIARLPPHDSIQDLYTYMNWSERRACIASKTRPEHETDLNIMAIFNELDQVKEIVPVPVPKTKDSQKRKTPEDFDAEGMIDELFVDAPVKKQRRTTRNVNDMIKKWLHL